MATVETELVEEISKELLLVKAENIQLQEIIVANDFAIHKLTEESNKQKLRIHAQRLINKKLLNEIKVLQEKLGEKVR